MSDIALPRNDERDLALRWSGRLSLTQRILAVNIFALALLAGSLFYLDTYRQRAITAGLVEAETEARLIAAAYARARPSEHQALLGRLGTISGTRLRVFAPNGVKRLDSWRAAAPTYVLRNPAMEAWTKRAARLLDRAIDTIVGFDRPPPLAPAADDSLRRWPEAAAALRVDGSSTYLRLAPEGTPFISAAAALPGGEVLLLTTNARSIRAEIRDERLTLGFVLLTAVLLSVLLSLFLARTIARPLRRLANAAHRVRLGKAREVNVPTLPARRDEIGLLARALHDMSQALRQRIDQIDAFAADVTHELKNPLASLRSAVDSLERVSDPSLQAQLIDVVRDDVVRLDRLITDIAEVSRLDAELSRARFEPVDLGRLIESLLPRWEPIAGAAGVRLAFARPGAGTATVQGDEQRLARALDNLVDNAISFSPPGGLVEIAAAEIGGDVLLTVEDEGPGVPASVRETIFNRFHSDRPDGEAFGRHSGLGLAIAKAVVDGHDAEIAVEDRRDRRSGARFVIRFPDAGR